MKIYPQSMRTQHSFESLKSSSTDEIENRAYRTLDLGKSKQEYAFRKKYVPRIIVMHKNI